MSSLEMTGKLHLKRDTQKVTGSFTKREIVVEMEDGPYTQYIKFELLQDRCSVVDRFNEGDKVKVSFNLRGREWNNRFFTTLNAWRVEAAATEQTTQNSVNNNQGGNDMPF